VSSNDSDEDKPTQIVNRVPSTKRQNQKEVQMFNIKCYLYKYKTYNLQIKGRRVITK